MSVGRLHVITPPHVDDALVNATGAALEAGAPVIQVRAKNLNDRQWYSFGRRLRDMVIDCGVICVVNDRCDIALGVGAHGVHLGADDLPVGVARRLLGEEMIIGATVRDPEQARRARDEGASYLGVGPCYASTTKSVGLPDPMGLAGIAAVSGAVELPVIAIAGVTLERVPELLDAGAYGVAVVSAIYSASDPGQATRAFLEVLG